MAARKEYDAVAQDLYASGDYDMKVMAKILVDKEKEN